MQMKEELNSKLNDTKASYNQKCIEIDDLSNKLYEIDKTEINLNNKETFSRTTSTSRVTWRHMSNLRE